MLQNQHTLEKNTEMEGKMQEILVEEKSKNSENDLMGRTSSSKIVNFEGETDLIGQIVKVKISKAYLHSLRGALEKNGRLKKC
jgi:tRNA-2-methylthio-N6-dimethylallyladenosine synthase